jgi:3-phenylpropionate/trans-cinnamate dioxygenase ferredoxin reductase subunit
LNDQSFAARRGAVLLDAALSAGLEIPHDCRAGQCGTCRVRVVGGSCWGGECGDNDGYVYACQCRIISDLSVEMEPALDVLETSGRVTEIIRLAPDVVEVCVEAKERIEFYRGQYYSVRFAGFPARSYSPTIALDWPAKSGLIRFNIRQMKDGRVSSALGSKIRRGHRVMLTGPYGSAYFRPDHPGRLVLVSSGTGFAPMWAIAEAAIRERPDREMHIVVAARTVKDLYMIPALCRIALFPRVTVVPVVSEPHNMSDSIRVGRPADFLPALMSSDMVYVCGSPALVDEVAAIARASGADCHRDAFVSHQNSDRLFLVSSILAAVGDIRSSLATTINSRRLAGIPEEQERPRF